MQDLEPELPFFGGMVVGGERGDVLEVKALALAACLYPLLIEFW